jgi:hypothetical protein
MNARRGAEHAKSACEDLQCSFFFVNDAAGKRRRRFTVDACRDDASAFVRE